MSYTQEQIDRANQVNLEEFLRSQGEQLIKSGNEWRWKRHDSLTIKGFVTARAKAAIPWDLSWSFSARASLKRWNC